MNGETAVKQSKHTLLADDLGRNYHIGVFSSRRWQLARQIRTKALHPHTPSTAECTHTHSGTPVVAAERRHNSRIKFDKLKEVIATHQLQYQHGPIPSLSMMNQIASHFHLLSSAGQKSEAALRKTAGRSSG